MEFLCSTSILSSGLCGIVYFPCNTGHPLKMLDIVDIRPLYPKLVLTIHNLNLFHVMF
jgi:hypothetical protein